ncbi:para-nitrobenzyl esterase [Trichoderma arundinaceum]|uniref:Carboxylic ester hydrolase n=1 Tax=Trichoderma arundinaceum TaxID=490622 RepID=A0A395P0T3_TRIAR|nr:para-nitrobenzyl esterase [Trichoderma arundinaceum]
MRFAGYVQAAWGLLAYTSLATLAPSATIPITDVTYRGIHRNGIEVFLNIQYGEDTGGQNRFKPPRPHIPVPGSTIQADSYGPACPQALGGWLLPLALSNITEISEDCLNLNIARPKGTKPSDLLPVMVYLHGGSFWAGSNSEITISPDGLILESVKNELPIIHVIMNYRLGFFGFAQSNALKAEGSENAGLRDQRLAIEWVRETIVHFGGNPDKITIFGQSSGGLAVGAHILSYGGKKPVPFQQAICESQALEPGITSDFTINAMKAVVDYIGCDKSDLHSPDTIFCLRDHDMNSLLNASLTTYRSDLNVGDIWLPVVDGDFLPDAPSHLIIHRQFAKHITVMMGWCHDDLTLFTDTNISTSNDTRSFITSYVPTLSSGNVDTLLSLYPVTDFPAGKELSSEFYRSARIFRDILMTCQPLYFAEGLAQAKNTVYLYEWNQTVLEPILEFLGHPAGMGPIHTSEFAYIFGNLSHYNTDGFPFNPSPSDYELKVRGSRSWSTFASTGKPGLPNYKTFQGFTPAYERQGQVKVFVAGGPNEGLSYIDGPQAHPALASEKLRERCGFLNSAGVIEELKY